MRGVWIVIAGGVFLALGWAQSLDPLIADPQHYRLEFQNQWVRVIRENMGPHEKALLHHHPEPGGRGRFLDRSEYFSDARGRLDADGAPQSGRCGLVARRHA